MTIWIVTRHKGALDWLARRGITGEAVTHLDAAGLRRGDAAIGNLPMHVAAAVCAKGARFLTIELDLPAEARGRELSAEEMETYGASLVEYRVERAREKG